MSRHRGKLLVLPPNRVWRTYPGGRTLDALEGKSAPADSHFSEDWIGSTTRAVNRGREDVKEGVSQVSIAGKSEDLRLLLESDPVYFLGEQHIARFGPEPMVLVKFLDPAVRLHFQCHPSREFAQSRLGSPSGKTEAYHILDVRPDVQEPCIHLGFQRPPAREDLRRMIEAQDIAGIQRCCDRIPVKPGDTFIIPGGVSHALGEGVFMIEIQEPTDLVIRFEFERAGYVLPEAARFMGRDIELALDVIGLDPITHADIERKHRCRSRTIEDFPSGSRREELIGPDQTPCFRVNELHLTGETVMQDSEFAVCVVTAGECTIRTSHGEIHLHRYDRFVRPAGLGPVTCTAGAETRILECLPPR